MLMNQLEYQMFDLTDYKVFFFIKMRETRFISCIFFKWVFWFGRGKKISFIISQLCYIAAIIPPANSMVRNILLYHEYTLKDH